MKRVIKFVKQNIIGFVLGIIVAGIGVVTAANLVPATGVTYSNSNSNVTNVNEALNELFESSANINKVTDMTISVYLHTYANGGSHSDQSYVSIPVENYSKLVINSISPVQSGYPKSYAITANGIALTAGKEIDLTSVDALSLSLTISSLESLYKNYGFQINFTLVV